MSVFAPNKNLPPPGSSILQCNTCLLTYYPTGTRVPAKLPGRVPG